MKFGKEKKFLCLMIIVSLIGTLVYPEKMMIYAEDESNVELLKQRIEKSQGLQEGVDLEISEAEMEINNDFKTVQRIVTEDKSKKKEYQEYYGGMYENDKGELVVQTVNATGSEQNNILNSTSNHVVIEKVENSYNDLKKIYETISDKFQSYAENEHDDEELKKLIDNMIAVSINEEKNTVVVTLESVTDEAKAQFKKYYEEDNVMFEEGEQDVEEETLLKLGRAIYVAKKGGIYRGSIGMKAYYINSSGEKVKGFVTAAHLVENVGDYVYIDSAVQTKIGKVAKRKYEDKMDAAFVKVTNENYTPSRRVYYADSKGTISDKYLLDGYGYLSGTYVGASIYKSGSTTYTTKGKILSTSTTVKSTDTGVVLTDLWKADYVSAGGDSGGAVFDLSFNCIAGIHRDSAKASTKWENIEEAWDLCLY